jgi:hypothetical protein
LRGGDNLYSCAERIRGFAASARRDEHRRQADPIEPRHQIGDGRSAAQDGFARRGNEHTGACHRQQCGCPTHLVDTFAATVGNLLQSRSIGATQAAQRLSLWDRHTFSSGQVSGNRLQLRLFQA